MKREVEKKYFLGILSLLVVVLGVLFVAADSYAVAPSTAEAGDTISMIIFNVSNTSATGNNLTSITVSFGPSLTFGNFTSVNISDGTNDYSNGSITGDDVTIDVSNAQITGETNFTVSITLGPDAPYGESTQITLGTIVNESNVTYSVLPYTSGATTITETTAPTATATCSPTSVYEGDAFPCTCSGTDSGAAASGVSTETGSSTSSDGVGTPFIAGTYTYTCTVTDVAGNSASGTATYTVLNSGGGGSATPQLPKKSHFFSKITPGVVSIVKDFDSEIGLKEIQILVNSESQNVKITVTKYDGKPANVSVEKSGEVYQYMEINADNLGNNLDKAIVVAKVEKSWLQQNGLGMNDISVSKFDEVAEKWNELPTAFASEDTEFYYYNAEVESFSFFAIGEKTEVLGEDSNEDSSEENAEGNGFPWLWIFIVLAIVVLYFVWNSKKK